MRILLLIFAATAIVTYAQMGGDDYDYDYDYDYDDTDYYTTPKTNSSKTSITGEQVQPIIVFMIASLVGLCSLCIGSTTNTLRENGKFSDWPLSYTIQTDDKVQPLADTALHGEWDGSYTEGDSTHPMRLVLKTSEHVVAGSGHDDLGYFTIDGRVTTCGRVMRWTKTYTKAVRGKKSPHSVLYDCYATRSKKKKNSPLKLSGHWSIGSSSDTFSLTHK